MVAVDLQMVAVDLQMVATDLQMVAVDLQMVAVDLQMVAERVPERAADAGCVYADGDCGRPRCNRHMPIGIDRAQSSHPMREHVWRCEAATVAACEAMPASEAVPVPAREAVPAPARAEATVEARLVAGEPESTYWSSCSSSRGPRSCNCHTHTHTHRRSIHGCLRLRARLVGAHYAVAKRQGFRARAKLHLPAGHGVQYSSPPLMLCVPSGHSSLTLPSH